MTKYLNTPRKQKKIIEKKHKYNNNRMSNKILHIVLDENYDKYPQLNEYLKILKDGNMSGKNLIHYLKTIVAILKAV